MASSQDQLRVVLIGRTGSGKSSTGNSLVHSRTAFRSTQSSTSITRACQAATGSCTDANGRQKPIMVVDTPGFFDTDTSVTNAMVERTITSQIFNMTSPGVHAFLIVLRIDRFTPEEKQTIDFIKTIFGAGAARYCILIFTREDQLDEGQTLEQFISSSRDLQDLVKSCGDRKMAINNKLNGDQLERKTKGLVQMIEQMVGMNNGTYYTNAEYQRIEAQRRAEQQRREQEERERKQRYEDELKAKARKEEQIKAAKEAEAVRIRRDAEEAQREEKRKAEIARIKKEAEDARQEAARKAEIDRTRREAEDARREASRRAEMDRVKREADEEVRRSREEARSARSQRDSGGDSDGVSALLQRMMLGGGGGGGGGMSPMGGCMPSMGSDMSSMGGGMSPMGGGMRSIGGGMPSMGGGHGGRFTGDYMSTRGAANGRPIFEGSRGGQYHMTRGGHKSYLPR